MTAFAGYVAALRAVLSLAYNLFKKDFPRGHGRTGAARIFRKGEVGQPAGSVTSGIAGRDGKLFGGADGPGGSTGGRLD